MILLVLASQSPQRSAILSELGVDFDVMVSDADELVEGDPGAVVVENALRKARDVAGRIVDDAVPVLGADTEVVVERRILGKPKDEDEARRYLALLSARAHEVWGGIAIVDALGNERTCAAMTQVFMHELNASAIDDYIQTGEWRGRAGGYAIQGRGAMLVERIEGDYLNVVGLAVSKLREIAPELLVGAATQLRKPRFK